NTDMTTSLAFVSGSAVTGSVRWINNTNFNAVLTTAAGVNTIDSGGIFISSQNGTNSQLITGPGQLTSGNGQDLIVFQGNTAAAMTMNVDVTGNIGLTKSGAGTMVLTKANSYTGPTNVILGTLRVMPGATL